jgi:Na+/melibiose symporter-like transporter
MCYPHYIIYLHLSQTREDTSLLLSGRRFSAMLDSMENTAGNSIPSSFSSRDYVNIAVFGFALASLANGLHTIILPIRVIELIGESAKSTYLGFLTFAGLIVAMLVQPAAGAVSDCTVFRWGRRRPYIVGGALVVTVLLMVIGAADSYLAIFVIWCLIQASSNVAQGAYQAFIPDLIPRSKRGRASGVKVLFEVVGGVVVLRLIGYLMGEQANSGQNYWLWLSLGILAVVLIGTMIFTAFSIKEQPYTGLRQKSLLSALKGTFKINTRTSPDFLYFLISRLLFLMALTTLQTFMLYYLQDVTGLINPAAATADLLLVVGITMIAVVYPTGYLSDRVGRKPIGVAAGIMGATGTALLLFSHRYEFILGCGGIIGISAGAFMSTNWALATDLALGGEEARYMGLTNLATAGGAALARLIGPAIDYFNVQSVNMGYTVMLAACSGYFIIGSALLLKIRNRASSENGGGIASP